MAITLIRLMSLISLMLGTCRAFQSAHGVGRTVGEMTHPQWRMLTSHSEPPSPAKAKFKDKDKSKAKAKMVGGPSSANPMRLERILSNRGVASRTEVAKGRVGVGGTVVRSGATRFPANVRGVYVDGEAVDPIPLLAAFHKPVGTHSTMRDPMHRENLGELALEWPFLKSLHPVGRLDADTSGLLLFCSDGHVTQTLLHPSSGIPREYEATVVGHVDHAALKAQLSAGVDTSEGSFSAVLLDGTEVFEEEVKAVFDDQGRLMQKGRTSETTATVRGTTASRVRLTVTEGKYRMVRRVLHNAGHSVLDLHRLRYGGVALGSLGEGDVRMCTADEVAWAEGVLGSALGQ